MTFRGIRGKRGELEQWLSENVGEKIGVDMPHSCGRGWRITPRYNEDVHAMIITGVADWTVDIEDEQAATMFALAWM